MVDVLLMRALLNEPVSIALHDHSRQACGGTATGSPLPLAGSEVELIRYQERSWLNPAGNDIETVTHDGDRMTGNCRRPIECFE